MLPEQRYLTAGPKVKSMSYQYSWDFVDVYNPNMIRVGAFIQNDLTKEVYQAVTNDTTNITTGSKEIRFSGPDIRIYPNPASDILNVTIAPENKERCYVDILDMTGRVVLAETLYENQELGQFSLNGLNKGVYFVRIRNSHGITWKVTKLVIMK